jgi:hypothetical protein
MLRRRDGQILSCLTDKGREQEGSTPPRSTRQGGAKCPSPGGASASQPPVINVIGRDLECSLEGNLGATRAGYTTKIFSESAAGNHPNTDTTGAAASGTKDKNWVTYRHRPREAQKFRSPRSPPCPAPSAALRSYMPMAILNSFRHLFFWDVLSLPQLGAVYPVPSPT